MVSALLLVGVLGQAQPVKLASPGLSGVQLSKEVVSFYSDHLAQQLSLRGLSVTTASDISSLIGFERQKQLSGCSDATASCLAELASALGVDGIITGSIGKFDDVYQVNLRVVGANDARQLAAFSGSVTSQAKVLSALTEAAEKMVPSVLEALHRAPVAASAASDGGGLRRWARIPGVLGLAAAGVGTVLMVQVGDTDRVVRDPTTTLTYAQATAQVSDASGKQQVAVPLLAVGGLALVGSGLMFALGAPAGTTVSAALTPRGESYLAIGGRFE